MDWLRSWRWPTLEGLPCATLLRQGWILAHFSSERCLLYLAPFSERARTADADAVDARGDVLVVVVEDGDDVVGVDGAVEVEFQFTFLSFRTFPLLCFFSCGLPGLPVAELPLSPSFAAADCLACLA